MVKTSAIPTRIGVVTGSSPEKPVYSGIVASEIGFLRRCGKMLVRQSTLVPGPQAGVSELARAPLGMIIVHEVES